MSQPELFARPEAESVGERREGAPQLRVSRAVRGQVEWAPRDLEAVLREDHPARAIWDFLDRLELDAFYERVRSAVDTPGRPATDPRVLLALWLLATVEGVGSARQLARLCSEHDAYRWLRGGVPINYHMLSDFRVTHQTALDDLMSQIVAGLMAAGAVSLSHVAQDGMRVRASAGAGSFRREEGLKACLAQARAQVARLAREREKPDSGVSKREEKARQRAAEERVSRVEEALSYLPGLRTVKDKQIRRFSQAEKAKVSHPRLSTTDPEARVMKMADGGYRPAYNAQFATDSEHGVIVGVSMTTSGSDAHQSPAMVEQIERRTGRRPETYLMDGGFAVREDITLLGEQGITVFAPVRQPRTLPEAERYAVRYGDSPAVIAWRKRMATEEGKETYRLRAALAEWTNAQVVKHGLGPISVRGVEKVRSVLLLVAIAHNLMRWLTWRS